MRPKGSAEELERRRRMAIDLLREGRRTTTQVAKLLGCDPRSVRRWKTAHVKKKDKGLDAIPPPGRPSKLNPHQKKMLLRRLLQGARKNGFSTDLWTCRRIAALIEQLLGVRYHFNSMGRFLASLGMSCQKPTKRAIERDDQRIARWIAEDWPRIKKTPGAGKHT